jgi:ubiquinone/menaquinone biosynthesis C-methylase UbiE
VELHEYHALERIEREHWFYKGKREIVEYWLDLERPFTAGDLIVDAGAGTGELVAELRARYGASGVRVEGIEYVEEARKIASEFRGVDLTAGSILALPYADNSVRAIMALDVLEHLDDDRTAWQELVRVTAPGGLIIVNVPTFMQLWSEWDVSLGHVRRYTLAEFRTRIAPTAGQFQTLYLGYVNAIGFLGIYVMRRLLRNRKGAKRAEDVVPSGPINALLKSAFVSPVKMGVRMPFGSSLLAVVRKR